MRHAKCLMDHVHMTDLLHVQTPHHFGEAVAVDGVLILWRALLTRSGKDI